MKKSLQRIEDYYFSQGLRGEKLRQATKNDKEYMEILNERWSKLTKNFRIKAKDKKRYIMSTDEDYIILGKIYQLERKRLSATDKRMVNFIRTQLEHDWRLPLIKHLDKLIKKYK